MASSTTLKIHSGIPQSELLDRRWKVLLYGLIGAGKTRTASYFPKPFFVDFEDGLGSIDRKIVWKRAKTWGQWLGIQDLLLAKEYPFETIVLDSVNSMQSKCLQHSVTAFESVRRAHTDIPGMSDYGKMFWDVYRSLELILELPYHVVLTAQATWGDLGEQTRPELLGKALTKPLLQAMDLVMYVERVDGDTIIYAQHPGAVTKDRFNLFPDPLVNPTWEGLTAGLEGRLKASKEPKSIEPELDLEPSIPSEEAADKGPQEEKEIENG